MNCLEALAALIAGVLAGSIALLGFGFDSMIEVSSGAALLWRQHMVAPEKRERAEALALKIVGVSFLALAAYILFDAAKSIILREPPKASYIGIGVSALSLVVMPLLARAKHRVATACTIWLVVGYPRSWACHDADYRQGRERSSAG